MKPQSSTPAGKATNADAEVIAIWVARNQKDPGGGRGEGGRGP